MTETPARARPVIQVRDLRFRYPGTDEDVLRVPFLDVPATGTTAITGPSGAGKSTLIELLAGTLREPYEGSVQVLGAEWRSLTRDADRQRQLRRIGLIPQDYGLLTGRTPVQLLGRDLADSGVPREDRASRAQAALAAVGLAPFGDRDIAGLSGGQRQRVAIARMLARQVDCVIADEPTANLDPALTTEAMRLFRQLADRVPVVIITHDPAVAEACDRTIVLQSAVTTPGTAVVGPPKHPRRAVRIAGAGVAVAAVAVAAVIGISMAANGKGPKPAPTVNVPPTALPPAATATPPASTATARPGTSARSTAGRFVEGLAKETVASISGLRGLVAGPVMLGYLRDQALQVQALADAGQQAQPGSVTRIPSGFQICGGGSPCDPFTGFRSDSRGRITDVIDDGQLVSGRLAVGTGSTSSGLVLSSIYSYLSYGRVYVTFNFRNGGGSTVGTVTPAFLPMLVTPDGTQFSADPANSVLPGPIPPGESVTATAAFDTQTITGQFSLRANGQYNGKTFVTSEIRKL